MEGLNKVFTSELQTYVSELKEVMFQKGYSDCQVQTYNKTWQSILSMLQFSPIKNSQRVFVNNSFRMYVPKL